MLQRLQDPERREQREREHFADERDIRATTAMRRKNTEAAATCAHCRKAAREKPQTRPTMTRTGMAIEIDTETAMSAPTKSVCAGV